MRTMHRLIAVLWIGGISATAQNNPVEAQFKRLMGEPKELASQLSSFPWKAELPDTFPGFKRVLPTDRIRIVSVEQNPREHSRWTRWESADGAAWVDLIHFAEPYGVSVTLAAARQPHSGYIWDNQLLLFSGTGDSNKEAIGTALITSDGSMLNVGVKLPFGVRWDAPLADRDRMAFDAALARFQTMLETLARNVLDPSYVSFGAKIEAKPEALSILRMAGFARLWSYLKYNFVFLDKRPEVKWDTVLEQFMPLIAKAKDDVEYGRLLERAVALLKDGHTNVYPNAVEPRDTPLVVLEPIESRPVATAVGNLSELKVIQPGMELLEIGGTPVRTIIERDLDPYISSSTTQDRQLRQMRMLLQGAPGSQMRTKWRTLEGKEIEASLIRNASQNRSALKLPSHPRFEQKNLPGNLAYIALNDFSDAAIDREFDREFDKLREANAWIVDLRWNGGGSSEVGYHILARFIDKRMQGSIARTRLYNPTLEATGRPQTWYDWPADQVEPAAGPHFQGPVYVLTSPNTCSAAEDFLIPLKVSKRITIVGEPTCGSSGQPLLFALYGATARVCTKWDRYPDGAEFVGVGVLPDVKAARTRKDVAAGRDTVLETAIALASHSAR